MTTINWTGGSGSWGNAADWNGGAVPNTADDVQIDVPNITVSIGTGVAASAYSLTTMGSTVAITGGALFTVNYAVFGGAYQQTAGVYMASGQGATFNNTVTMSGGTMEALAGAAFNIADGGSLAGTFAGTGTLDFTGGTTYINAGFSSTISNIEVNALVGFNTNFSTSSYFAEGGGGSVDLFGHKLTLSGNVLIDGVLGNGQVLDKGTLTIGSPQNLATLDNGLLVTVASTMLQAGNVNFGTGDAGAKIVVQKQGHYLINGNWNIYDPSSIGSMTNAGVLAKTGGGKTATIYTSLSSTGTINTETGMLSLNGLVNAVSGTVTGSGTLGIGGSGQTIFGTKLTLAQAAFDQQSGVVVLNHALSFGGEWDMNGGVLNLNSTLSTLTLSAAGHANFDGGTISGYGGDIVLDGATQMGNVTIGGPDTLTINGTLDQTNSIAFGNSSNPVADISAGATWSLQGDSDINGTFGLIDNQGTFIDPNGSGVAVVSPEFVSTGVVTVDNGTLRFSGPAILGGSVTGDGLLDLAGSAVLQAGVSIAVAALDVNGVVSLGGNLDFADSFTQAGGTLDLGGNGFGLAGTVSLDNGTLTDGGTLTVAGQATIGNYLIAGASLLDVTGSAEQTADLTIYSAGLTVDTTGTYTIDDNNNINLVNGAELTVLGDFIANGTGSSTINPVIDQTGTLQVNNGTLQLASGGTLAGLVAGSGTLSLSGSPFLVENGFDATVSALVLQSSASLSIGTSESFAGYFVDNGYLNLSNNATFSTSGTTLIAGNVNISGAGTVVASNDTTLSGVNVLSGATLDLTSTVEQGPANVSVGTSATVIIGASSVYTLDAGQSILGSGVLDVIGTLNSAEDGNAIISPAIVDAGKITSNLGTLDILNAVSGSGSFVIGATGTLEFALGSTITASNTISFSPSGGTLFLQDEAQDKPTFSAELAGFGTGDKIELYDFSAATTTGSLLAGNKQFMVTDSSDNNSITLTFTTAQSASSLFIGASSDGRAVVLHH